MASRVYAFPHLLWNIPASWSYEEATTVPMAYVTAYYALIVRAGIQRGDTVLIHSATSAVGQAAVRSE